MTKIFYKLFLASLLGALLGSFLTLYSGNQNSASISSPVISVPTESVLTPGLWEKISSRLSSSSVGIQVYGADRLVREGSGLVVSSDGLIVAPADLAISGGIYQVFHEDKIYKGQIVLKSYKLNLLLLKTEALYSNVADLDIDYNYQSGQEILMLGKIFELSKPSVISQRGLISYVTEKSIAIDSIPNSYLLGTGVANLDGKFIGLSYLRNGKINIVRADLIDGFFREYLNKSNK